MSKNRFLQGKHHIVPAVDSDKEHNGDCTGPNDAICIIWALGVTTSNNSDFTVMIVTVGSASGSLKAEPKECLTGKGQVLSKGLRAERISRWLTSILLLIKIV